MDTKSSANSVDIVFEPGIGKHCSKLVEIRNNFARILRCMFVGLFVVGDVSQSHRSV